MTRETRRSHAGGVDKAKHADSFRPSLTCQHLASFHPIPHLLLSTPPVPPVNTLPPPLPNPPAPQPVNASPVLHAWAHLYLMRQTLAAPLAVRCMANKPAIHHSLCDDLDRNRHSLRDNHTVARGGSKSRQDGMRNSKRGV